MAFIFKPTTASGVSVRHYAARLAKQVELSGAGSGSRIVDGYVLRAVRKGPNVVVYVLDPLAVWAFLYPVVPGGFHSGTRALSRDNLMPGAALPDTFEAIEASDETRLFPYTPGYGFWPTFDSGALLLRSNIAGQVIAQVMLSASKNVVTTCTMLFSGAAQEAYSTRLQLFAQTLLPSSAKYLPLGADTSELAARYDKGQAFLMPESGLVAVTGDINARFTVRFTGGRTHRYRTPALGGHCALNGLASPSQGVRWYADPIFAGAYVSQPPPAPAAAVAPDLGVVGRFIVRMRRPPTVSGPGYENSWVDFFSQLMTANPEPELRPLLISDDPAAPYYAPHGVVWTGACYTVEADELEEAAGQGSLGTTHLFSLAYCAQGEVAWSALQLVSANAQGVVQRTLLKTSAYAWHAVGPAVDMFGVKGVVGTSKTAGTHAVVQTSVEFLHYGTDGVIRTTGLRAADWYAFTPIVGRSSESIEPLDFTGQSNTYAASIGDGKVAVLARDYIPADADDYITWSLVIVDQQTGAFIESRGPVGTAFRSQNLGFAHISVITPEVTEGDVTTPAVLLCSLFTTHRLSTDGGRTWSVIFEGFRGMPLYLGNPLRKIDFGEEA